MRSTRWICPVSLVVILMGCTPQAPPKEQPPPGLFDSGPARNLMAVAARWADGDATALPDLRSRLDVVSQDEAAPPGAWILAARVYWLLDEPEAAEAIVRKIINLHGDEYHAHAGLPLSVLAHAWRVSLAYQAGNEAVLSEAVGEARAFLDTHPDAPWAPLLCETLRAYVPDKSMACDPPPLCDPDDTTFLICLAARMKAHAMAHYMVDGPPWPEGLKLAEADEETTWRILHAGVSLLFTTDTLFAGVADPPQAPAEETPHTRHLNVLTRAWCEHALTKRFPGAVRHSIRFRLATHLLDNGDTEAGQAHLRKLMEGDTYYSVFCAHGLREDADTLPGQPPQWDQVEVFETYPWLVDYLEP